MNVNALFGILASTFCVHCVCGNVVEADFSRYTKGRLITQIVDASVIECLNECGLRPSCILFNYHARLNLCELLATDLEIVPRRDWLTYHISDEDRQDVLARHCVGQVCTLGEKCSKVSDQDIYECRIQECDISSLPRSEKILPPIPRIRHGIGAKVKVFPDLEIPPVQYHCCRDGFWKIECNAATTPAPSTSQTPTSSNAAPTTSTEAQTSSTATTVSDAAPTTSNAATSTTTTEAPTTPSPTSDAPTTSSSASTTASSSSAFEWHSITNPSSRTLGFSQDQLDWNSALEMCAKYGQLAHMETLADLEGLGNTFAADFLPEEMWLGGKEELGGTFVWVSADGLTSVSVIDSALLPITTQDADRGNVDCIYLAKDNDLADMRIEYNLQVSPCTDVRNFLCQMN